jgi:transcriptional regulator with XRE-family HTH domain
MSSDNNLPSLSPDTVSKLKALRDTDKDSFYALVWVLRTKNWPLRAIAEPLGVSRTAVQGWERKATAESPLPEAETMPTPSPKERTSGTPKKDLSDEECQSLRELAEEASTVRRYTDENAPARRAAALLESKLYTHRVKGVSLTQLAEACGVSRSAVAQRLRKFQ